MAGLLAGREPPRSHDLGVGTMRIKDLRDAMKLSQKQSSIHNLKCELAEERNRNAWLENEVTRLTEVNRYVHDNNNSLCN